MRSLHLSQTTLGITLLLGLFASHALPATALKCGDKVGGEITTADQVEEYTYAGEAGGMITLTPAYSAADVLVFDPSGKEVLRFPADSGPQQLTLA